MLNNNFIIPKNDLQTQFPMIFKKQLWMMTTVTLILGLKMSPHHFLFRVYFSFLILQITLERRHLYSGISVPGRTLLKLFPNEFFKRIVKRVFT